MTLTETYNAILNRKERKRIRESMREVFGVGVGAVYNWLSGRTDPPEYMREKIAEIFGKTTEELFPAEEEEVYDENITNECGLPRSVNDRSSLE